MRITFVNQLKNSLKRTILSKEMVSGIGQPSVHLYNRVNTLSCGVDEQGYTRVF